MMKVRDNTAPTGEACTADVENSRAALAVFDTTQRLFDKHGVRGDDFLEATQCGDPTTLQITNVFDAPILASGLVAFGPDDKTTSGFKPFLTDPIAPGARVAVQVPTVGAAGLVCRPQVRVVVAPVGDLAADAGLGPAGDVPQASNDPAIWLPQVWASSSNATDAKSLSLIVANVEDIHSPDVFGADAENNAPPTTSPSPSYAFVSSEFCEVVLQKGESGTPGELVMVASEYHYEENRHRFDVGLFRRGSDGIWRYLGRTLYVNPASGARCSLPPH